MEPFIEFVCDEHLKPDGVGPFVTRMDGAWAYCAGHGQSGHRWRRIPPKMRSQLEAEFSSDQKAAG